MMEKGTMPIYGYEVLPGRESRKTTGEGRWKLEGDKAGRRRINVGEEAEEEGDVEMAEETAKVKVMRKPEDPTQEEFEAHMVTHMPFRAWCPHCIKGRAKAGPHRKLGKRENCEIPTIGMDYTYMKSRADREGEPEQEEE